MAAVTADEVAVELLARYDKLERQLRSAEGVVDKSLGNMETRGAAFVSRFSGLLAGVSVAALGREFLQLADQSKQIDAQLKLATRSFGAFGQAQADVIRIAGATRNGLSETSSLYGNLIRATQTLGGTQDQAARATETFSKALKLGGADAAATASATLQFGQALASGVLRGDEFNSIAEASPRLLQLIADALGKPKGELRALAEQGKLTSDVLFKALTDRRFTAGIDDEFKTLPVTFSDAMQKVQNAALLTFGAFDRGGNFSTALANFVSEGADGFRTLGNEAEKLGADIRATFVGLGDVFSPLVDGARAAFGDIDRQANYARDSIANILRLYDNIQNADIGFDRFYTRAFRKVTGQQTTEANLPQYSDRAGAFTRGYDNQRMMSAEDRFTRTFLSKIGLRDGSTIQNERVATPARSALSGGGKSGSKGRTGASEANKEVQETAKLIQDIRRGMADLSNDTGQIIDAEAKRLAKAAKDYRDVLGEPVDLNASYRPMVEDELRRGQSDRDMADDAADQLARAAEDKIQYLGGVLEDVFTSSSDQFWENFKRNGLRQLALITARAAITSFSSGGGGFGSLLGNLGKAASAAGGFGRASGGYVGPGETVRVNENRPGVELLRMGSQGGTVIPLGQAAAVAAPSVSTRHFHITVDARNSVTPAGFAQQIISEANRQAAAMDGQAIRGARAGLPGALDRYGKLGTTG